MLAKFYEKFFLKRPKIILFILAIFLVSAINFSKEFQLDASSDTLLIEGDPDLKYLNEINKRYNSREFLVLTYSPNQSMISDQSINNLLSLKYKIQSFDWVHSVITLLDVPLLSSTDETLTEKLKNFSTLKSDGVDRQRGFEEILESPVFKNFVISEDGKTSGIIVYIKEDDKIKNFKNKNDLEQLKKLRKEKNHKNILEIRSVIKDYDLSAKIHLGGIPMIADDMMSFIKNDIFIFGIGVLVFIIFTLWFVFKKIIWIIIPLSSCIFSVVVMTGMLGLIGWKVTVISSNFIALMLILTMAMNIHMSTRFLQLKNDFPDMKKTKILEMTTKKMFLPIMYTALTTICAFLSLIFSGIKPVIDFGWMMTLGLLTSLITTFTLLPSLLSILSDKYVFNLKSSSDSKFTKILSHISISYKKTVFVISITVIFFSFFGISKLRVENSFINYFSKDTEIYKGMKLIDDQLGGTTPLEIILKFPKSNEETETEDEDWGEIEEENNDKYWFTKDKVDKINKVHNYLEELEHVGKVLSFSSILKVAEKLNNDKPLGSLEMGVLYTKLPDNIKKEIVSPYISIESSEARINLRVKDSNDGLRRNDLINKINYELENKLKLKKDEFKLAGVLIIFNNLLQSLFKSQILTLGFVMMGILLMFLILFKNIKLSLIGVIPNFIAAFFILGIIGVFNIPLDMMTITIAAITIGIAVDNSIHYIYRFKEEFFKLKDYQKTLKICHSTVGIAILNTSITIVFGFSILVLSNFIPTIYFGVFTGIAMLVAMLLVLTLLPSLLLWVKPFDKNI
ncbi:MAG: hypothetical protein CBE49_003005 [Rickettsiales bacterium TMED289]|nr:MAG: hypothetical protein CBE49_003005 [Rickettsiales bacterium TMED289]|tara:strand:- start:2324 stop:4705 length:2382 start_codon:yes stop_codon:yes gene_type:complete